MPSRSRWQSAIERMPILMNSGSPKDVQSLTKRPRRMRLSCQAVALITLTSMKLAAEGWTVMLSRSNRSDRYSFDCSMASRALGRYAVAAKAASPAA